ncbi:unnamed protein product [Nesidiocoris tenuis]|uniref:Uncharacterized protein n=1 Tax=Nesidiocoris tenuis TaxID=355587 RepID=A0A6H5G743_9HEMI|nr:unnamed protein product [Nesidiocoris tenuis]
MLPTRATFTILQSVCRPWCPSSIRSPGKFDAHVANTDGLVTTLKAPRPIAAMYYFATQSPPIKSLFNYAKPIQVT